MFINEAVNSNAVIKGALNKNVNGIIYLCQIGRLHRLNLFYTFIMILYFFILLV